jgi:hypothetical protein
MEFTSSSQIKDYILKQSEIAVRASQEKIYQIIERVLKQFYDEFDPVMYKRTNQLMRSLVKSDVKQIGNQIVAEVYFDLNKLDYSMKYLFGDFRKNTYHREDWTKENDAWVLENAMVGTYTHGGYPNATGNTRIWIESMSEISKKIYDILKTELESAGIPIK